MVRDIRFACTKCLVLATISCLTVEGRVNATEFSVCWDGGASTSNWSQADNWEPSMLGGPRNLGNSEFLVTIGCQTPINPDGIYDPVNFDLSSSASITDFLLRNDSRLVLNLATDLTVLRTASIAGIIDAQGGDFIACGTNVTLAGDRSRMYASGGSTITICAPTYSSAGLVFTTTILNADGQDSTIDLQTLTSLSTAFDDFWEGVTAHTITATNGGVIDLSAVGEIIPPSRSEDFVGFALSDALSTIRLDALHTIGGEWGRTSFLLSNSAVQNLPALTTIQDTLFTLSGGAQLHVNGASASYSSVGMPWTDTIMSADGVSTDGATPTLLDLSAVTSFSSAFDDFWEGATVHTITATNGGVIDLSAVGEINPPIRDEDFLSFEVHGPGSLLDLSTWGTVAPEVSGWIQFTISNGGRVILGDLNEAAGADVIVNLISADSRLELRGSANLRENIKIQAPEGGHFTLAGDFLYAHTDTANHHLGLVNVECVSQWQWLEVGGTDFGLDWEFLPDDNFGFKQLVVGGGDQSSVVQLVDLLDNHQHDVADALYLFGTEDDNGVGGVEGLRILGGSTLVIGELKVYMLHDSNGDGDMERTRVHDLFAEGETRISFDQGYIIRPAIIPPIGAIDARQSSNPNGSNWGDWLSVDLVFFGGPLDPVDFLIEVTNGAPPTITGVILGIDKVHLDLTGDVPHLDPRTGPGGARMKITHVPSGSKTCIGYLPGDVSNDRTSSPVDVLRLIDHLNGVQNYGIHQTDIDRSGLANPADVLRVIDLLNGADAFNPWLGLTLPECP